MFMALSLCIVAFGIQGTLLAENQIGKITHKYAEMAVIK